MKKISVLLVGLLFIGCGVKNTPLANVNQGNAQNQALIIGTVSRAISNSLYHTERSFEITDLNDNKVQKVSIYAKFNLRNPLEMYTFQDDFQSKNSQGSVFSVSVPAGDYKLQKFHSGKGPEGYTGSYAQTIHVNNGDVVYVGDINIQPTLKPHSYLESIMVVTGAKTSITNKLERDYNLFQKKYNNSLVAKEKIKVSVDAKTFPLENYADSIY